MNPYLIFEAFIGGSLMVTLVMMIATAWILRPKKGEIQPTQQRLFFLITLVFVLSIVESLDKVATNIMQYFPR